MVQELIGLLRDVPQCGARHLPDSVHRLRDPMLPVAWTSGLGAARHRAQHGETLVTRIRKAWAWIDGDENGQGLAEYALILALIAIIAIVALIFLGSQISSIINDVGNSI